METFARHPGPDRFGVFLVLAARPEQDAALGVPQ